MSRPLNENCQPETNRTGNLCVSLNGPSQGAAYGNRRNDNMTRLLCHTVAPSATGKAPQKCTGNGLAR
jgi:hypothetical protein